MQTSHLGIIAINEAPPPLDLTPQEIAALAEELVHSHAAFAELDDRQEQAHGGYKDLHGLLRPMERKSIDPLALALDGGEVQAMQPLMGQGQWQDEARLPPHGRWVDETLGEADGVVLGDRSECPTSGAQSVGVARPWCGRWGNVDPCQSGVCTASASRQRDTLVDRRLYLPAAWGATAHRERWNAGGMPEETPCKTQPALALARRPAIAAAGFLGFR